MSQAFEVFGPCDDGVWGVLVDDYDPADGDELATARFFQSEVDAHKFVAEIARAATMRLSALAELLDRRDLSLEKSLPEIIAGAAELLHQARTLLAAKLLVQAPPPPYRDVIGPDPDPILF